MSLDDLMITCFCVIDDALPAIMGNTRVRHAGPQPNVSDRDVRTIDVGSRSLGLTQEKTHSGSFRRQESHVFPALAHFDRTTVVRQVATRWAMKARVWMWVREEPLREDPETATSWTVSPCRSVLVPVRSVRGWFEGKPLLDGITPTGRPFLAFAFLLACACLEC
jgi:hypothetical protein